MPDDETQNWVVHSNGHCLSLNVDAIDEDDLSGDRPYRLYRFLTELEDILGTIPDDVNRIRAIAPRVRKLLTSSYWLQMEYFDPPTDPGWAIKFLYREHNFPLTVQMVSWLPGNVSPIHNHATWGIVAVIGGQEKNRLWRRSPTPEHPERIELVEEKILVPGDIIGFLPDAIHSVEPLGDEPAVTFNLYGVTDFDQRFEFDSDTHTATLF